MKGYEFKALNRAGKVIYTSLLVYRTNREALIAGCVYLQSNFAVKEISVVKVG